MSFLHPEYLWFLFALTIPVFIHLFHFRNKKTVFFSSLKFVKEVNQSNKSFRTLKKYLVLACRVLLLTSLIFAFAQPIPTLHDDAGRSKTSPVFIYIDNSLSMQAIGNQGELLSEAREIAKKYLKSLEINTPIIVHTNKLSGSEKKVLNKSEAKIAIDNIDFIGFQKEIKNIIQWQNETLKSLDPTDETGISKRILISDFQQSNLKNLPTYNLEDEFFLIKTSPEQYDNLTIDSVWFDIPVHNLGVENQLNFRIQNFSKIPKEAVELNVQINEENKNASVNIPANSYTIHSLPINESSNGIKKGKISINDNQLFWDDDFFFSYEVKKECKVLIVEGEEASNSIEKALSTEKAISLEQISIGQLNNQKCIDKNLIILNGVNDLSSGVISILKEFNEIGGSVLIVPGSEAKLVRMNGILAELGLPQLKQVQDNNLPITNVNYNDPFFTGIFTSPKANITINGLTKYYPAVNASNVRKLISLRNETPVVSYSKAKNFLFHFSLSSSFGTISANDIFSTLLLRISEIAANPFTLYANIGKSEQLKIKKSSNSSASLSLDNETLEFFPKNKTLNSYVEFSLSGMEAVEKMIPGFYRIKGAENEKWLAVNYSREESQTSYFNEEELKNKFQSSGMDNIQFFEFDKIEEVSFDDNQKTEWWRYFLFLAIGFALIEMLILKFMK